MQGQAFVGNKYNERGDNYRIRIWDLVGIDDDEYMDLQILRTWKRKLRLNKS